MSSGDFSSVVQLGVGLHAGSALLQTISEFASAPMSRRLSRLSAIAEARASRGHSEKTHHDMARDLVGDLEIKKIQFFNEYREVVAANAGIAVALCVLLAGIAFWASKRFPRG